MTDVALETKQIYKEEEELLKRTPKEDELIIPPGQSINWKVFRITKKSDNYVWCIICKKWLKGSTKNMKNMNCHVKNKHVNLLKDHTENELSGEKKDNLDRILTKMLIECNMSINTINNESFVNFVKEMSEYGGYSYKIPSRHTLIKLIDEIYITSINNISKEILKIEHISLTTDSATISNS
jgi:hypothetical protein